MIRRLKRLWVRYLFWRSDVCFKHEIEKRKTPILVPRWCEACDDEEILVKRQIREFRARSKDDEVYRLVARKKELQ